MMCICYNASLAVKLLMKNAHETGNDSSKRTAAASAFLGGQPEGEGGHKGVLHKGYPPSPPPLPPAFNTGSWLLQEPAREGRQGRSREEGAAHS